MVAYLRSSLKPVVLLGATTWWQLSARMAMALKRQGYTVMAVCPLGHPLRFVKGIERVYDYDRLNSLSALRSAIISAKPDILIPCDDGVVWQLHDLHRQQPELRSLIEESIGPSSTFATLTSRAKFLKAASEIGVRIPWTEEVHSKSDLSAWKMDSGVLKIDGTWGGSGVAIFSSREEMDSAYDRLTRPRSASLAWKRLLVNHDPLALWSWKQKGPASVTIQEFIQGRPANTMFAAWHGELLGLVTVEVHNSLGATGAATVVKIVENEEIKFAATKIAKHLNLHGFHGLDFIMERDTHRAFLLELNPRCTQLGHLPLPRQGDLAGLFAAKHLERAPLPMTSTLKSDIVAFFPVAFRLNPDNPYLVLGHHDVPWEEPALVHELLRGPWPERQLLARLYHFIQPPRNPADIPLLSDEETSS